LNTAAVHGRRGRSVEYSVGFAVTEPVRDAIALVPKSAWATALDADGEVREHADVVEITGLLPTSLRQGWPAGMRVIVRREHPHPGAQLSLFEQGDGWRYQAFATNTTTGGLALLEARHRAHARVEDRIRVAKDSGLGRFPSREYGINQAWLSLVALAADLTSWLRLLALPDALKDCEPKALRYRFLHVPARLTRSARRRHLDSPRHGPGSPTPSPPSPRSWPSRYAPEPQPRTLTAHDQDPRRPAPQRHAAIPRTPKPVQRQRVSTSTPRSPIRTLVKDGG